MATSTIVIVPQIIQFNMFTYPPSPLIHAGENLVSDGHGSLPTMNFDTGIGTREQIILVEILWRCDSILLKLSTCFSGSEAVGGHAWPAIRDLGGDSGTNVMGVVTDNVLIASDGRARGVDDNVLAKDNGGGESASRRLVDFGVLNDNLIKWLISCVKWINRF
jgi:hypothetical protein